MTVTDKRVALVTGASRGAGAGIARALGSYGMRVYVTGRAETVGRQRVGTAKHSRDGSQHGR